MAPTLPHIHPLSLQDRGVARGPLIIPFGCQGSSGWQRAFSVFPDSVVNVHYAPHGSAGIIVNGAVVGMTSGVCGCWTYWYTSMVARDWACACIQITP